MSAALPDLAARGLGGSVVAANDELFAARENLIRDDPPIFQPHTFGPKGQVMDGWETRRRRTSGSDWAIVRLGLPGIVRTVIVDTAYFVGNFPAEAAVEACAVEGHPSSDEVERAVWTTLVPRMKLQGDSRQEFAVDDDHRWTHVRLTIYPDGGVARLRVLGQPVPDPRLLLATLDLAALENGARVLDCSNAFYSTPSNLLKAGHASSMGDGWETARRRDDGNDWVEVQLACAGRIAVVELDTTHFVGNAPGAASVTAADGTAILARAVLQPDTRHRFVVNSSELDRVRLDIYPDGGMARLRLWGEPTETGRQALGLRFLAALPDAHAESVLQRCCSADSWVRAVRDTRPYASVEELFKTSDKATMSLDGAGFLAALAGHPRIGDRPTEAWSREEQSGVSDEVRSDLAQANAAYEQRFGHVYLVCATGHSGADLLELCRARVTNDPATERGVALAELAKINRVRLTKLLGISR